MDAIAPKATQDEIALIRLERLEAQIEILTKARKETVTVWNPSVIIALAAFAISLITTGFSAYRTYRQDVDSRKQQLASAIQSTANAAIQSAEMFVKYKNE